MSIGHILVIWGVRFPGGDIPFLLSGASILLITAIIIFIHMVIRAWSMRRGKGILRFTQNQQLPIIYVTTLVVLGLITLFNIPFRIAFAISRKPLEKFIVSQKKELSKEASWIGVFPITSVTELDEGIVLTFPTSRMLWAKRGLYFSSSGNPIEQFLYYNQHDRVSEKWFSWTFIGL